MDSNQQEGQPAGWDNSSAGQPTTYQAEAQKDAGEWPAGQTDMNPGQPTGDPHETPHSPAGNIQHPDTSPEPYDEAPERPAVVQSEDGFTDFPAPTRGELPDEAFDIPIDKITLQLGEAGVAREERTIRGYCDHGKHIHCRLRRSADTRQMKYHSYQSSIDQLVDHLKQVEANRKPRMRKTFPTPSRSENQKEAGAMPAGRMEFPPGQPSGDPPAAPPSPAGNPEHSNSNPVAGESQRIKKLEAELMDARIVAEARKQTLEALQAHYAKWEHEIRTEYTNNVQRITERATKAEQELLRLSSPEDERYGEQ